MNTFPYIRDVVESKSKDERLFCYQDINLMLSGQEKTRKMLNIDEQWKKIKKKYLCRLDSLKSLGLFIMITKYGSNII